MRWLKAVIVAVATLVLSYQIFDGPLGMYGEDAFWAAIAATIIIVFLWGRLSKRLNL